MSVSLQRAVPPAVRARGSGRSWHTPVTVRSLHSATVHGELSVDGARIILIATGEVPAVKFAARQIELLTPIFKPTEPAGGLQVKTSWPVVVQLASVFGKQWRPGPRLTAWIADQVRRRVNAGVGSLSLALPAGLVPYEHQVSGALMIAELDGALPFDDPGTGKTITAVLGLAERAARGKATFPAIVVCPNSVVDPWVRAVAQWTPWLKAVAWRGQAAARRELAGTADIYVTSYGTARMDAKDTTKSRSPLVALGAKAVVADECHLLKNPDAQQTRAVRRLAAKADVFAGLSGTPIAHTPEDLWPTLNNLVPNAWPSGERWVMRYCLTVPGAYKDEVAGLNPANEEEFRTALLGQYRRVAKADVLDLPPKVYSVREVEVPTAHRKIYTDLEDKMLADMTDLDGELIEAEVFSTLTLLGRLSVLACAAADVEEITEEIEENGITLKKVKHKYHLRMPSWKVETLLEVLAERCQPGGGREQVVVFASSKQLVELAAKACEKEGYRVARLVGGQSAGERTREIDAFQAGEKDVICVTTQAGGVGVTLTAARTCVFLQRPWSLVDATQAEDRLHRIGAEHESIEVIDIVAKHTVDSRVRSVLREKAGQLADLVQDPRVVEELLGGSSRKRGKRK